MNTPTTAPPYLPAPPPSSVSWRAQRCDDLRCFSGRTYVYRPLRDLLSEDFSLCAVVTAWPLPASHALFARAACHRYRRVISERLYEQRQKTCHYLPGLQRRRPPVNCGLRAGRVAGARTTPLPGSVQFLFPTPPTTPSQSTHRPPTVCARITRTYFA